MVVPDSKQNSISKLIDTPISLTGATCNFSDNKSAGLSFHQFMGWVAYMVLCQYDLLLFYGTLAGIKAQLLADWKRMKIVLYPAI